MCLCIITRIYVYLQGLLWGSQSMCFRYGFPVPSFWDPFFRTRDSSSAEITEGLVTNKPRKNDQHCTIGHSPICFTSSVGTNHAVYIYIYISLRVYSTYSWMYYVIYYVWHVLCESNSKKKVLHQIQQMDDDLPKHLTSNHFSSRTAPPCKWQQPPGPVMWCKHSWRHMPHRCGLGKDDMVLPSPIGLPTWKL